MSRIIEATATNLQNMTEARSAKPEDDAEDNSNFSMSPRKIVKRRRKRTNTTNNNLLLAPKTMNDISSGLNSPDVRTRGRATLLTEMSFQEEGTSINQDVFANLGPTRRQTALKVKRKVVKKKVVKTKPQE